MTNMGEGPSAVKPLYESAQTRVIRARRPDGTMVIVKQLLGPHGHERGRRERTVLERLDGVDGIVQLAPLASPTPDALVLEDWGACTLADVGAPFEVGALVALAHDLALAVGRMHRAGVVHQDINPSNILAPIGMRGPTLIDLGLATTNALERPEFTHHREVIGTLAYLAPEQTGRTGRPVDLRADLYALGATLYELATGRPPFDAGEALQLIHDHLARVPVPPIEIARSISPALSGMIMRLLEKEPERRYQSADGLAHDLGRLRADPRASFALGERDYPFRLSAPSRLVGRGASVDLLRRALDDAIAGRTRSALVTGAPGVGKTALVDELRAAVTEAGGWFVSGKYDQHREDLDAEGFRQALRGLGRLLLAEPEAEVEAVRRSILAALGPNASGVAALLPEFAALLGTVPRVRSSDPAEAASRSGQAAVDLLRAVVSPIRPLVLAVDDLQWASPNALGLLDALLTGDRVPGLLVVGAYRDTELGAAHPLRGLLDRWERLGVAPALVRLENLPVADLTALLAELLRLPSAGAARLAGAIGERTAGNPYDTLELVNALRRDGTLVPSGDGWSWDEASIRRFIGEGDVADLLGARIATMPPATCALLEVLACLGGSADLAVLESITGTTRRGLDDDLAPALEDGLVVIVHDGGGRAEVRHDRVLQAVDARLAPDARIARHLDLARRLGQHPELAAIQYLHAAGEVDDPTERRAAADLFRAAASDARLTNSSVAAQFLAAAIELLGGDCDRGVDLVALETELHAALYNLGRFEEADAVYASIVERADDPIERNAAACVQVCSLANRGHAAEAVALGIGQLERLGHPLPDDVVTAIFDRLGDLAPWVAAAELDADLARPEVGDRRVLAAAEMINKLLAPALFSDRTTYAWLVLEGHHLWVDAGPCAALVPCLGAVPMLLIALQDDHAAAYGAAGHVIALSDARGYDAATASARFMFAVASSHWFEPLDDTVGHAQLAREGLLHGGDLQFACFTYSASIPALLDTAPTLDRVADEVEAGLGFAARTGNDHATGGYAPYRQLLRALLGETAATESFADGTLDDDAMVAALAENAGALCVFHVQRSLAAAVFGDADALAAHTDAAMPLLDGLTGRYPVVIAHLLRSLSLADRTRDLTDDARDRALAELHERKRYLERRAADAPGNFHHLLALVEAEEAWANGDLWAAAERYDSAAGEVEGRSRPWHRALIAERAAAFHLAHGREHTARSLLRDARAAYDEWGATGKVAQLDHIHSFLRTPRTRGADHGGGSSRVSSDAIDLVAVLEASQALSSETSLDRLHTRVGEVLRTMTGATSVRVILADDDRGWIVPPDDGGTAQSVEAAAAAGQLPLSAFRYAERTREPLLVDDACTDDRFARDPYLVGVDRCSLLVVPILNRGEPQAMLVLENHLSRGVFTAERLDAVTLVAGQLAVSLDNAHVYASLEQKVAERTEALQAANARLEALSSTDPLTGVANRRRLADAIDAEWRRAARSGSSLAVAMIDIDRFKAYNDRYGHIAGDACLRRVAAALNESVRGGIDLVARYGGEEFALVLPGTDIDAALAVAERVRAAVAALDERHEDAETGRLTVSIGLAITVPTTGGDAGELLEAADEQLYAAKRAGRDRIEGAVIEVASV